MSLSPSAPINGSPFHEGERRLQEKAGKRELVEKIGRKFIRPFLTRELQDFFDKLPYLFLGARTPGGWPLPFLMSAPAPFITVIDDRHMILRGRPKDAPWLRPGQPVGLLGLDLSNRRRNRVNGRIVDLDADSLTLAVEQAFGNCPQYINIQDILAPVPARPATPLPHLTPDLHRQVRTSRRFFIASGHDAPYEGSRGGMDMSHRGGPEGFVQMPDARTVIFPDYSGNNHFNSLGNILTDGRAGLLFVDFDRASRLHILGRAEVIFDDFDAAGWRAMPEAPEARRLVRVHVKQILHSPGI